MLIYIKKCFRVYNIFVMLLVELSGKSTFTWFSDVHLDIAMKNCPCVKTGVWKLIPMYFTDYPCNLLIVIANANQTGNWCLERWKPVASTGGDKVICGIKFVLPSCCPPMRWTSAMDCKI